MKITLPLTIVTFCALQVLADAQTTAPNLTERARYAQRVAMVGTDLRWAVANLWRSWEQYQEADKKLQKPTRSVDPAATKTELAAHKASLIDNIAKVRTNAKRLRSLSPVPRAWKKVDDKLIEASLEWDTGVEILETWLLVPSDETKNSCAKHLRRAETVWNDARREVTHKIDPQLAAKKYFD